MATATASAAKNASPAYETALRVGWAVRNRVGQVVVIYEGATAEAAAQEWARSRDYSVDAVTL